MCCKWPIYFNKNQYRESGSSHPFKLMTIFSFVHALTHTDLYKVEIYVLFNFYLNCGNIFHLIIFMLLCHAFHTNSHLWRILLHTFKISSIITCIENNERVCVSGKFIVMVWIVTYTSITAWHLCHQIILTALVWHLDAIRYTKGEYLNGFICIKLPQIKWITFNHVQERRREAIKYGKTCTLDCYNLKQNIWNVSYTHLCIKTIMSYYIHSVHILMFSISPRNHKLQYVTEWKDINVQNNLHISEV